MLVFRGVKDSFQGCKGFKKPLKTAWTLKPMMGKAPNFGILLDSRGAKMCAGATCEFFLGVIYLMYRVWSIKSLDPSLNMCHSFWWNSVLNILQGWYHMSVSTCFPFPNTQWDWYILPTFTYKKLTIHVGKHTSPIKSDLGINNSPTFRLPAAQEMAELQSRMRDTGSNLWDRFRWMASGWISAKPLEFQRIRTNPPPRGREKLGLFRVLPKTPISSQMLKVLSQLHHHHHHLFLSHPCNPSQTFHDSFILTSQPSCSCMIPPWVLILFSIPLSSMLALFHSHWLTET